MNSEALAEKAAELMFEKKGFDVKILALKEVTTLTDYFVICSADSDTQVRAIADHVEKTLRDNSIRVLGREGYTSLNWVLLDYVDVVVHVFKKDVREFYNLERLWADVPVRELTDPVE
ncbi:MAG: ribosome silencing factor [Ignavibacteriaceae bacterium]|nr:ribosome silencing factor [Ignavibacteriaceae bacterium]